MKERSGGALREPWRGMESVADKLIVSEARVRRDNATEKE